MAEYRRFWISLLLVLYVVTLTSGVPVVSRNKRTVQDAPNSGNRIRHDDVPNSEQELSIGGINDTPVLDVDPAAIDDDPVVADDPVAAGDPVTADDPVSADDPVVADDLVAADIPVTADGDVDGSYQAHQAFEAGQGVDGDQPGSHSVYDPDPATRNGSSVHARGRETENLIDTDEGGGNGGAISFGGNGGNFEPGHGEFGGVVDPDVDNLNENAGPDGPDEHEQGQGLSGTLGRRDVDPSNHQNETFHSNFLLTAHESNPDRNPDKGTTHENASSSVDSQGSEVISGVNPHETGPGLDPEHAHEHIPVEQPTTTVRHNIEQPLVRTTLAASTRTLDNDQGMHGVIDPDGDGTDHGEVIHHSGDGGEAIHEPGIGGGGDHLNPGLEPGQGGMAHSGLEPGTGGSLDGDHVIHEGSGSHLDGGNTGGRVAIDKDEGGRPHRDGSGDGPVATTPIYPATEPMLTPRLAILPTPAHSGGGETDSPTIQSTTPHSVIEGHGEIHSSGDHPTPSEGGSGDGQTGSQSSHLVPGEGHLGPGESIHEGSGQDGIHEGSGNGEETGEPKGAGGKRASSTTPPAPSTASTTSTTEPSPSSTRATEPSLSSSRTNEPTVSTFSTTTTTGRSTTSTDTTRLSSSGGTTVLPTSGPKIPEPEVIGTSLTSLFPSSTQKTSEKTVTPQLSSTQTEPTSTLAVSLSSSFTSMPVEVESSQTAQLQITTTSTVQSSVLPSAASRAPTSLPEVSAYESTFPEILSSSSVTQTSASENLHTEAVFSSPISSISPTATAVIQPEISSQPEPSTMIISSEIPPSRSNSTTASSSKSSTSSPATEPIPTSPPEPVIVSTSSSSTTSIHTEASLTSQGSTASGETTQATGSTSSVVSPRLETSTTTGTPSTISTHESPSSASTTRAAPVVTFGSTTTTERPFNYTTTTTATTSRTDFTTTPFVTTKKWVTRKSTEKTEPTSPLSQTPLARATTLSFNTLSSPFTTRRAVTFTTQVPEKSTPPPLFIQIEISMSWQEFCSKKTNFIASLQEIIRTEKQVVVRDEQIKIPNLPRKYCMIGDLMGHIEGQRVSSIRVQMYIVDTTGKVDMQLTIDAYSVIGKGFQDTVFKDKIVNVHMISDKLGIQNKPPGEEVTRGAGQKESGVTMVIVIASVGGFCCLLLILLQLVLIHRRVKAKAKLRASVAKKTRYHSNDNVALGAMSKSQPNSGYWNPALDIEEEPFPLEYSHVLNYSSLANFCMDVNAIYEEFQNIPCENSGLINLHFGEDVKNRFANVIPHSHSRVKLKMREGDKSDYINASYIKGYKIGSDTYIATQSPLVNTVRDFWRMVWEQQSRIIIMLNPKLPSGKYKQSTCYWPDDESLDSTREYGDYTVNLKKRVVHKDYVECFLEIKDIERNLKRDVHHFLLTCWPDLGMPEPLSIIKFILDTRPYYEDLGVPPIVHCGPGTGRTGVLIAVDMCMRMYEARKHVDFFSCVYRIRKDRLGMVQTKEQYALIYQALNEYAVILGSPSVSSRSSVITLHAML